MFGSRGNQSLEERVISSLPWGTWGDDDWSSAANTTAGVRVTNRSALQLLAVYGCVEFICEGISTLPIDTFRRTGDRVDKVATPAWLEQPTVDLDSIGWRTQMLTSLLLDGNAYARKVYSAGMLAELQPLDPASVTVRRESGRKQHYVNGVRIDSNEILHVPGVMFPGSDVGLSPLEAARQTIGKAAAVEDFAAKFFSQGMNLGGVIEDPGPVDADKATKTARIWARLHAGNRRAHLPGVLQGGAVWKSTGVTNEQAQFLQTQQFTAAQIAAFMFRIDPTEFGVGFDTGSSVTYANLEQRNARKVQVTFLPWIIRIEKALSSLLPRGQFVKLNVSSLLRGDTKTRFDTYEVASRINTAAASIGMEPVMDTAEMREFEDWGPYDGPEVQAPAKPAVPASAQALHLHVPPAEMHVLNDVQPSSVTVQNVVEPTPVSVTAPDVHVDVAAPDVLVRNVVEPTPVQVHVESAPVVVPTARSRRVERDVNGVIVRVVEE